ncbi:MAG: M56 family metallopeptidase [Bacteroidota bacterium]
MIGWGIYLLKVATIQAIALVVYQLLLDGEPIGHFKRAYLILSLLVAFIVPTIAIWEVSLPLSSLPAEELVRKIGRGNSNVGLEYSKNPFDWSIILWTIYLIGLAISLLSMLKQLWPIFRNYRSSLSQEHRNGAIWIAMKEPIRVHSFGRLIFYQKNNLPSKIIRQHELAHVRQWHTTDRILIRLLRVFWWFNPVLFFYERAIRHNHELLADKAALELGGISVSDYLDELLSELHPKGSSPAIANHLPYQFTKKRFHMIMHKPMPSLLLGKSSLIIFCWVAVFIYFGHTIYGQNAQFPRFPEIYEIIEADRTALENQLTVAEWKDLAYEEVWKDIPQERRLRFRYEVDEGDSSILFVEDRINSLLRFIERTERRKPLPPSEEEFADWQNPEKWRLVVDDQVIDNDRLAELIDREDIYQTHFTYYPKIGNSTRHNRPDGTANIITASYRAYKLARVRETLAYLESFRE